MVGCVLEEAIGAIHGEKTPIRVCQHSMIAGGCDSVGIGLTRVLWKPSNPDTLGTIPSVMFSEVS